MNLDADIAELVIKYIIVLLGGVLFACVGVVVRYMIQDIDQHHRDFDDL